MVERFGVGGGVVVGGRVVGVVDGRIVVDRVIVEVIEMIRQVDWVVDCTI